MFNMVFTVVFAVFSAYITTYVGIEYLFDSSVRIVNTWTYNFNFTIFLFYLHVLALMLIMHKIRFTPVDLRLDNKFKVIDTEARRTVFFRLNDEDFENLKSSSARRLKSIQAVSFTLCATWLLFYAKLVYTKGFGEAPAAIDYGEHAILTLGLEKGFNISDSILMFLIFILLSSSRAELSFLDILGRLIFPIIVLLGLFFYELNCDLNCDNWVLDLLNALTSSIIFLSVFSQFAKMPILSDRISFFVLLLYGVFQFLDPAVRMVIVGDAESLDPHGWNLQDWIITNFTSIAYSIALVAKVIFLSFFFKDSRLIQTKYLLMTNIQSKKNAKETFGNIQPKNILK